MSKIPMTENSTWQPNKWIAALLSLLIVPLGMLYLGRKSWASFYFGLLLFIVLLRYTIFSGFSNDDLWFMTSTLPLIAVIHAFLLAPRVNEPRKWFSRWYGLIAVTLAVILPVLTFRVFFSETFHIPASSMAPTLEEGDLIEVKKWGCGNYRYLGISIYKTESSESCRINRGDVIVFQFPPNPSQDYVKRVMAVGGDQVNYKEGVFYVNDQKVIAEFINSENNYSTFKESLDGQVYQIHRNNRPINHPFKYSKIKVPEGHYYVVGDNRDNSSDSRIWGVVPEGNVIGKLSYVYK